MDANGKNYINNDQGNPQQQQQQLPTIIYDPSLQPLAPSTSFGSSLNILNNANIQTEHVLALTDSSNNSLQRIITGYDEIFEDEELKQLLKTWKLDHLYNYLKSKAVIFGLQITFN